MLDLMKNQLVLVSVIVQMVDIILNFDEQVNFYK